MSESKTSIKKQRKMTFTTKQLAFVEHTKGSPSGESLKSFIPIDWPEGFNERSQKNASLKTVKDHIKKLCETDPKMKERFLNKELVLLNTSETFSVKSVVVEKLV